MKNIDLIPQWYKASKRRQRSLRGQYIFLSAAIVIVVFWNFVNANSLSNAKAQYHNKQRLLDDSQSIIQEYDKIKKEIMQSQKKAEILQDIDSKINIPAIISELGFVADEKVVLSDLKFTSDSKLSSRSGSKQGIRVSNTISNKKEKVPVGNVRFKGLIRGVAADTADVGEFVRRLESSDYFQSVSLAYSRTSNVKISLGKKTSEKKVSQFEINCYLENFELKRRQTDNY